MKKFFMFIFVLSFSVNSLSNTNLSGNIECKSITSAYPERDSKLNQKSTVNFSLQIYEESSRFKRISQHILEGESSTIERKVTEEGTIDVGREKVSFYPLSADVEIIRGKELFNESDMEVMMSLALDNETGTIEVKDNFNFIYTAYFSSNTSISFDCIKIPNKN